MPLLRLVVMHGWRPRTIADPRLLEPLPGPKIAYPVEPRWKFWVRRDLRTPTDVSIDGMINAGVTPKMHVTLSPPRGVARPTQPPREHDD